MIILRVFPLIVTAAFRLEKLINKLSEVLDGTFGLICMQDQRGALKAGESKEEKSKMKQLLQLLSSEELRELCLSSVEGRIAKDANRRFMIERIVKAISDEDLLSNKAVVLSLLTKSGTIVSHFWNWFERLEKSDLKKICEDVGKKELVGLRMTKSQILERIMANIPLQDLLKSKHLLNLMHARKIH